MQTLNITLSLYWIIVETTWVIPRVATPKCATDSVRVSRLRLDTELVVFGSLLVLLSGGVCLRQCDASAPPCLRARIHVGCLP